MVPGSGVGQPAAPLVIRLFGPFTVEVNGQPLTRLRSRKGQWLLALLALRPDTAVERTWLADTLWPDSPERQALYNLRRSLSDLRRTLGSAAGRLRAPTPHTLALELGGAEADVVAFDAAIGRGDAAALEEAVALYRGPLLEGCEEEWVFAERRSREEACLTALERLAEQAMAHGDPAAAVHFLRRAVVIDPLSDTAHRALMQALAASGDPGAATHLYQEFRRRLHRELNALPAPETNDLFQQIRIAIGHPTRQPFYAPSPPSPTPSERMPAPVLAARPEPSTRRRSLPRPLTGFVGRDREVSEIRASLATARLVTLTGAGGVGKTRLAIQVAEGRAVEKPDEVCFVDLAALADPALVPQAVVLTLGGREQPGCPLIDTLVELLQSRPLLLLLDNCEHLLEACARLATVLLGSCPRLRILTTSRQALGLAGEVTWRVPSLSLPALHTPISTLLASEAVQLFLERAAAAAPSYSLTAENAPAVAQLCRRLDGIPLALELAAGRLKVLTVEQIVARLDDRFRLLTGGSRTALLRHQTLRATMEWSWDLLPKPERLLIQRLAVFAGSFSLDAAEAVCSGEAIEQEEVLDLLAQLTDKSLVVAEPASSVLVSLSVDLQHRSPMPASCQMPAGLPSMRYRLLETTREFVRERVAQAEELESLHRRHRDWYLALAEQAAAAWRGPQQRAWSDRLEVEIDNLRAALEWSQIEEGSGAAGLQLAVALVPFWMARGYRREGREWLTDLLAQTGMKGETTVRAEALHAAGMLALHQQEHTPARALLLESLALFREMSDRRGEARALATLGLQASWKGDHEQSRQYYEQRLAVGRELQDRIITYDSLYMLAREAQIQGDDARAEVLHAESLALKREQGDQRSIAQSLRSLGELALKRGNGEQAEALLEESLALLREAGDRGLLASVLETRSRLAQQRGKWAVARSLLTQALALAQALGERRDVAACLEGLARVTAAAGQAEGAALLSGAAHRLRETIGTPLSPRERAEHEDHVISPLRSALGELAFEGAWAAGRAMPLEQAIALALYAEAA